MKDNNKMTDENAAVKVSVPVLKRNAKPTHWAAWLTQAEASFMLKDAGEFLNSVKSTDLPAIFS